jgi:exodeoxyribonuclease VII large subunit
VLTGIGHERDETIADIVAHQRCKTPTAVAEFLNGKMLEAEERLEENAGRLINIVKDELAEQSVKINSCMAGFAPLVRQMTERNQYRLNLCRNRLWLFSEQHFVMQGSRLKENMRRLNGSVTNSLLLNRGTIRNKNENLKTLVYSFIRNHKLRLDVQETLCKNSDPKVILGKGYSLTKSGNRLVRSANDVQPGQELETILKDGSIISKVEGKKAEQSKEERKQIAPDSR